MNYVDGLLRFDENDTLLIGVSHADTVSLTDADSVLGRVNKSREDRINDLIYLLNCSMDEYINAVGQGNLSYRVARIREVEFMGKRIVDLMAAQIGSELERLTY